MIHENGRETIKTDELKYDTSWKHNITLSDDEDNQQQIMIVRSDDEDDNDEKDYNSDTELKKCDINQNADPTMITLNYEDIEWTKLSPLIYMDEPGIQIFIQQNPDIPTFFNCFFPKSLFEMFQQTLNHNLSIIIRKDYPGEMQFQNIFSKKKFNDNEVSQFIGMSLIFGIFRFPTISSYWHNDLYLKGGIEICMQEGRFKFMENNMMVFREEEDYQKTLQIAQDVRKKWKKIYTPDQELILFKNTTPTHTIYYLIDSETLYILDEVVMLDVVDTLSVQQMLNSFQGKNHILYFTCDSIDINLIMRLADTTIYPVGQISIDSLNQDEESRMFLRQFEQESTIYCANKMCLIKIQDKILVFPKFKGRQEDLDNASVVQRYQEQSRIFISQAERRIICIDLYKSPFSYQKSIAQQIIQEPEVPVTINALKIIFEESLEGSIYNMFSFYNSIFTNNQHKQTFKQFKLAVAGSLVGEKYYQLEADRKEILRRSTLVLCQTPMQTDTLSFGLPKSFEMNIYHYPIQVSRSASVKFCVVCMKYENLSKSYFYCNQCQKQIGQKIFLCVFPCFEIYHKNPTLYVEMDMRLIKMQPDEIYFRIDQSDAANKELDQEYIQVQYYNFNNQRNFEKPPPTEHSQPVGKFPLQPSGKKLPNIKNDLLNGNKPNARYAPSFYNWSYNRGFKQRNEDAPIEKNFEQMINGLNQQTIELLARPLGNKNIATIHNPNLQKAYQSGTQQRNGLPQQVGSNGSSQMQKPTSQQNKPVDDDFDGQETKANLKKRKENHKSVAMSGNQLGAQLESNLTNPLEKQKLPKVTEQFKSPFEKYLEQVQKKTNQTPRNSKQEEEGEEEDDGS